MVLKHAADGLRIQHLDGRGTLFLHLDAKPTVMDRCEEAARGRLRDQVPKRVALFTETVERRNEDGSTVPPTLLNRVQLAIYSAGTDLPTA